MILTKSEKEQLDQDVWAELREEIQSAIDDSLRESKEISMMLEQSQLEMSRLTQRNATINAQLQQVQSQIESLPRSDIRSTYNAALDAQQRLFVMRGQIEKLQSDRARLDKTRSLLDRITKAMEAAAKQKSNTKGIADARHSVEMVIQAQEAERQRLAKLMHDEPAQALSNFILQTEIAMRLFDIDTAKAKAELASLKTAATGTFQKVRDFIFELRPMMLDDLGLAPTLNRYAEAMKEQSGIDIRLTVTGLDQRLEPYLEVMIFRAIQELLGNAIRHSQATQIKVLVDMAGTMVKVTVDDNGKGFDIEAALNEGMGIKLIRDRVEMLNGMMEVDSVMGQGTRVTFQAPATITKVFA